MNLNTLLEEHNITKYRLSKDGSIPYSTIADICCGKTKIEKCSAETIYKISKVLNCTMEDLIKDAFITESEYRTSFSVFKSNVCHAVKDLGDIEFLIRVLENDEITKLYKKEWYPETLYLLAMVDYLSRINNIPLCNKYDNIRCYQLDEIVDIFKNAGYTHMQFGPDMTDGDKGEFRKACGRKGIVPVGIYPNEFHVRKMIAEATDNLPEEAVIKYKEALAKQLRENIAEQGQKFEGNRLEKTIKNLEGAVKYDKFNSFASKKLLPQMMRINAGKDAVEIIAACQVYNAMLVEYGEDDNKLKGLSPDELLQEFKNRLELQQEDVKAEIDERYKEAEEENNGGKSINMSDIIGTMTSNAKSDLEFTMSDIKGDCGIDIQRIPITKGKFSYTNLQGYQRKKESISPVLQNARAQQRQRA